jgi:PGF-pre-PGF domain-containing protein
MGIFGDNVRFTGRNKGSDLKVFPALTSGSVLRITPAVFACIAKAVLILSLVTIPATALDWTTETVDSSGDTGWYTSADLDNSKRPRISYLDWTNRHLKYAMKDDGIWTNETVDSTNAVGEFSSLKLDASSNPMISYYDSNGGNLTFAVKNGDLWTISVVDRGGVGRFTSLALDNSGNPQISYQDLFSMKLKYAKKTNDTWTNETVDNSGNVGAYSSLALDSSGNPYISYYDGANGDLKYAKKIGGQWINQTVDSTGNVGYHTSIALDGSGNPHISYYDGINRDLKYATLTGSSWTKKIIDATGSVGKYTSLAIDPAGNPHISYLDETNGHLKYATIIGSVWTNETVDTSVNVGGYTSLVLDGSGNPHISYRDFGNNDLKFASGIPPLFLDFIASTGNGTAPLTVRFSDNSTGGLPSLWNWSFGDGTWFNTSLIALKNPEHVYVTPGSYTVNLTVRNLSVFSTLSRSDYVTVVSPPETTVPTTSPTPSITLTPTPAPTPTITSTPVPSPTLTPSPTPTNTSTPVPTPTLTQPPTPIITSTPVPSPTLTPSPTPTNTSTPVPTPTLTPPPTPTMTSTPVSTPTLSPSPAPAYFPDEGSENDNNPLPAPSSAVVPQVKGDLMYQTVNAGGDSAISRVTVTGRNVSDSIVTARIATFPPHGAPLPDRPVYQYIEVNLSRCGVISNARVEFTLPLSIADHNTTPDAVSICMLRNNSWTCLPTSMLGEINGKAYYSANTPVFTFFAITVRNNSNITAGERFSQKENPQKNNTARIWPTTSFPASRVLPASAAQNTQTPCMTFFFLIAGIIGIGAGVFLVKYGWIRFKRQRND